MPFIDRGFKKPHYKRIIICCDGTWQNSDEGEDKEDPTNVTRIGRAIKSVSKEGVPQIVFYQNGVGTSSTASKISKMIAGGTGKGLSDNIKEAYLFLANNYHPGDGIYLFGFSRGAYTARSIAGLIGRIGILTKKGMDYFGQVFRDYTSMKLRDDDYVAAQTHWDRIKDVRVTVVGCWDTVGSLGLPESWFTKCTKINDKYKFHDTALGPGIENAFHCLALDERRRPFSPTLWRLQPRNIDTANRATDTDAAKAATEAGATASQVLPKGNSSTDAPQVTARPTVLRQVWFPGVHTNVGGGYPDQEIANITLMWMVEQCLPFLTFDEEFLESLHPLPDTDANAAAKLHKHTAGHWAMGTIYDSYKGITKLAGAKDRTPGEYYTADRERELSTAGVIGHTNEEIHPCVRARYNLSDKKWKSKALMDWEVHRTIVKVAGKDEERWVWVSKKRKVALLESEMGPGEKALCGNAFAERLREIDAAGGDVAPRKSGSWNWTWFRRASRPDKPTYIQSWKSKSGKRRTDTGASHVSRLSDVTTVENAAGDSRGGSSGSESARK